MKMHCLKRIALILPLISALFLISASCSDKYFTNDGCTWGTTYHIVYRSHVNLADSVEAVMSHIDGSLSLFNPESALSAVNCGLTDSVDADFVRVFACAARVHALSGGMFDPTVAPVADLWGFGPAGDVLAPDSAALASALKRVGLGSCRVENGMIVRADSLTSFDFSALAKGYGVDCIAEMLERNGCADYMVEVGGEIVAAGRNPSGKAWRIQIDAPVAEVHSRFDVVELGPARMALASSGNYRNFRVDSLGVRYGHTISPLDGRPVRTATLAATVSAADCMTADALATAAMCVAPDSALTMLAEAGARGLLILADGDSLRALTTPQFP